MQWRRKLRYWFPKKRKKVNPVAIKKFRMFLVCGLFFFFAVWGFFRIEARIAPLVQQAALAELNRTLNREIHKAVEELVTNEKDFHALTHTQRDESGRILSMSTNYQEVNRIKSLLVGKVESFLDTMDVVKATIPMGMLVSDSIMTGFGVSIPVRVFATNAIEVSVADNFVSAGINQTRYKLEVVVTVPARIAGLTRKEDTIVTVQIPIEEMILVGEVPKTYLARTD